ncbi:MAG: glycoside hydrolase family 108 protein [Acetobacteraceae bacterium]
MSSVAFAQAVAWVIGWEGGYTDDPGDSGNWTGGAIGVGNLQGTKFGISAAAYPTMDIPDLTVAEAQVLYARDYWTPIQGDALPPALAMVVFDGAVNSGVAQSAEWLQVVVGAATDGVIGPATLAAVSAYPNGVLELCWEVLAQRVAANGCDPDFPTFGLGWSRRTSALAFQAATML